jgi:rSAM/selenodomain-associated transferase 1
MSFAIGVMCKPPRVGFSKTRLASALGADAAAALSAAFLRDVASAVEAVPAALGRVCFGVYCPSGAEAEIRELLPRDFGLLLRTGADIGAALLEATRHFVAEGYEGAILVNGDSPTLPTEPLVKAIEALRRPGDRVAYGPAADGGYYLIGLKHPHDHLFHDVPWSTPDVLRTSVQRAAEMEIETVLLDTWYDGDDATTLDVLIAECAGSPPPFARTGLAGHRAAATCAVLVERGLLP